MPCPERRVDRVATLKMHKLLVCQHVAYEPLGTLDPMLRRAGFRIRFVNFGREPQARPSLAGYNGLVVLGGPMSADDDEHHPHLATEVDLVREAADRDLPVLGVCLGAQLVARALGGQLKRAPEKEIGWYDVETTEHARQDPLFGHMEARERIFQWHGDTFDLPGEAVHLVRGQTTVNQAFRVGRRVYGLQFHMEVDEAMIHRWLGVPHHVRELAGEAGRICPEAIRRETPQSIGRLRTLADRTFGAFIDLFDRPARRPVLPSR